MNTAPPPLRAHPDFAAAEAHFPLPPARLDAVLARVELATALGTAAVPAAAPAALTGTMPLSATSRVVVAGLISAVVGAFGGFLAGRTTVAAPVVDVVPVAAAADLSAAPAAHAPVTDPVIRIAPADAPIGGPARPAVRQAPVTTVPTPSAPDALSSAERLLVEQARSALARNDLDGAEAALQQHAATYGHGAMVEDADALAVLVALKRGREGAADAARAFLAAYPKSLYAPAIARALPASRSEDQATSR